MAVLANRVGQAAGRHGGSVLERELFGSFDFLVGFVLPLGFQHALEVQARRHVCRRTRNTKHGAHVSQMMPQKHHHCPPVPKKHSRLSLHGPGCLPRAHGGPATLGPSFSNLQLLERSTLLLSQPKYILAGERDLCQESHVSPPLAGTSCAHVLFCYLRSDFQEAQLSQHIKSREVQAGREEFSLNPPFQVSPKANRALCEVNLPDGASEPPNEGCATPGHSGGSG